MGQYYNVLIERDNRKEVFDTYVNGHFIGQKLMEHSYLFNPFVNAIAEQIYEAPAHVAWVGDYSDETAGNCT